MTEPTRCFTDAERLALGLLAAGWQVRNAHGVLKVNSTLVGPAGETRPMARAMMARFRDAGIIRYVAGSPSVATITQHGRKLVERLQAAPAAA